MAYKMATGNEAQKEKLHEKKNKQRNSVHAYRMYERYECYGEVNGS